MAVGGRRRASRWCCVRCCDSRGGHASIDAGRSGRCCDCRGGDHSGDVAIRASPGSPSSAVGSAAKAFGCRGAISPFIDGGLCGALANACSGLDHLRTPYTPDIWKRADRTRCRAGCARGCAAPWCLSYARHCARFCGGAKSSRAKSRRTKSRGASLAVTHNVDGSSAQEGQT